MEERDRRWRERERPRSDDYEPGEMRRFEGGEARSWRGPGDDDRGPYGWSDRERMGGTGYEGRNMRRGWSYRPGQGYRSRSGRPEWQDRDYQGVSPAMRQREYDLERRAERYQREHPVGYEYGDYYGDNERGGWVRPRGYEADHRRGHFAEDYEDNLFGSGVTSGGGEQRYGRGRDWEARGREAGRETGEFLRRTGERVASWFGGEQERRDCRGMGPKGYKRSDERISDEVHERLTDDPYVDASNITITVAGGEVTLSGTVEDRDAKHRAEWMVEDVSGVCHVQNNLRAQQAGQSHADSVLERQTRGETGSGETIGGSLRGSRGSGGASTDTGKSR